MPTKPTAMYRPLLREAWRRTWHRKSLWVFGLLAACLTTGGVGEVVIRGFQRVQTGAVTLESMMSRGFPGYEMFGYHVRQWELLDPSMVTTMATVCILIGIFVVIAAVISQAALVKGVDAPGPLTLQEAIRKGRGHFFQVLAVDILTKIAFALLFLVTALPLWLLRVTSVPMEALISFAVFAAFLFLAVGIAVMSMIAIIEVVREERHALDGIHAGWKLFQSHWIASIEYGLILFALVIGAGLAVFSAATLASIPFGLLLLISILVGSTFLFAIINTVGMIVFFAAIFAFVGGSLCFQYAAWTLFFDKTLMSGSARLRSKVHRLWAKR